METDSFIKWFTSSGFKVLTFSDPESSHRSLIPSSCNCCPAGTASSMRFSSLKPNLNTQFSIFKTFQHFFAERVAFQTEISCSVEFRLQFFRYQLIDPKTSAYPILAIPKRYWLVLCSGIAMVHPSFDGRYSIHNKIHNIHSDSMVNMNYWWVADVMEQAHDAFVNCSFVDRSGR